MRVALVQEQRLAVIGSQLQLAFERLVLRRARREIAEVIQPALTHGHHLRMRLQRPHFRFAFGGAFHRMVRVHTGGGVQESGVLLRQLQGQWRMLAASAGDHQLPHAGIACALQHRIAITVERVVGEVGADIDQLHVACVVWE